MLSPLLFIGQRKLAHYLPFDYIYLLACEDAMLQSYRSLENNDVGPVAVTSFTETAIGDEKQMEADGRDSVAYIVRTLLSANRNFLQESVICIAVLTLNTRLIQRLKRSSWRAREVAGSNPSRATPPIFFLTPKSTLHLYFAERIYFSEIRIFAPQQR